MKQWRGLATRYDKHAIIWRAAARLHAVVIWFKAFGDTPYPGPKTLHRRFRKITVSLCRLLRNLTD